MMKAIATHEDSRTNWLCKDLSQLPSGKIN